MKIITAFILAITLTGCATDFGAKSRVNYEKSPCACNENVIRNHADA